MSTLRDAMRGVGQTAQGLVAATGQTAAAQAYVGWPTAPDLMSIINQGGYAVSVYPLKTAGQPPQRRFPRRLSTTRDPVTLTIARPSDTSFTFGGTPMVGANIFALFDAGDDFEISLGPHVANYKVQSSDTLGTIATAMGNAINALSVPGVTASENGDTVSVAGVGLVATYIAGTGTAVTQVARRSRHLQVTAWCPSSDLREAVYEAIVAGMGTDDRPWIKLADGTFIKVTWQTDVPSDEHQTDYALYLHHIVFNVEYGVTRVDQLYAVGLMSGSINNGPQTALPVVIGG